MSLGFHRPCLLPGILAEKSYSFKVSAQVTAPSLPQAFLGFPSHLAIFAPLSAHLAQEGSCIRHVLNNAKGHFYLMLRDAGR